MEASTYGAAQTAYAYTGEYYGDYNELLYLRARYYASETGRFLTRDTWGGNENLPITYNKWVYANANPIRYIDPSGHYVYNRASAASYAMNWDHQAGLDPKYDFTSNPAARGMDFSNQCTLFASSVLYEGGVRDPRQNPNPNKEVGKPDLEPSYWDVNILKTEPWLWLGYSDDNSWYRTTPFYKFASTVIGTTVLTYNNPPQYVDTQLYGQNAPINQDWENRLRAARASIQQGDLVFYGDGNNWDHVAVVVGWGLPTTFGPKSDPGSGPSGSQPNQEMLARIASLQGCTNHWMTFYPPMPLRPLVVERSGGITYTSWRSLDNTLSPVNTIKIVHIENR